MGKATEIILLNFLIYLLNVASEPGRCPTGLHNTSLMVESKDVCYQFVDVEKYWDEAGDFCWRYGGRLVTLNDFETNRFIVTTLNNLRKWTNNGVWIGLQDRFIEMNFHWVTEDRLKTEPLYYSNWGDGHPGAIFHNARDCVRIQRDYGTWRWHETPCHVLQWRYRFICQYRSSHLVDTKSDERAFRNGYGRQQVGVPSATTVLMTKSSGPAIVTLNVSNQMTTPIELSHEIDLLNYRFLEKATELKTEQESNSEEIDVIIVVAISLALLCLAILVSVLLLRHRRLKKKYGLSIKELARNKVGAPIQKGKMAKGDVLAPMLHSNRYLREHRASAFKVTQNEYVTDSTATWRKNNHSVESDLFTGYENMNKGQTMNSLRKDSSWTVATRANDSLEEGLHTERSIGCEKNFYTEIPENKEYFAAEHVYESIDDVRK